MVWTLLVGLDPYIVTQNEARKLRSTAPMNVLSAHRETDFPTAVAAIGGLRLRLFIDMEAVKPIWLALEATGISSVYQSFVWCRTWLQRVGRARNITPCVIVAENLFGETMFVLPFQLRRKFRLRVVESLTAPQGAYGFGLFNKAFLAVGAGGWFGDYFNDIVAMLPKHDVLHISDIPGSMMSQASPLLEVQHFKAANQSHVMDLQTDYQALLEQKRSSDSRRSMRKRDVKLQSCGTLLFELPLKLEDRKRTIDVMLAQQKSRLAEVGVHGVFGDLEQQFIRDLIHTQTAEGPLLRPYRLMLDGKILAVMLGAYRHGTYWALISSLAEGDLRKHSPGDYALRAMIKALCEDGTTLLDFSAGDTAYKSHWSDRRVPLYFIVRATTLQGLPLAGLFLLREKLKRLAKTTPGLNTALFALRRHMFGRVTTD
jgi:CelD/BcsL family acetyltransferase involved in cellulose biosynthesis